MTQNRSYPDISFCEKDTDAIVSMLVQSYEIFTGRTLYPADPVKLFILWIADIIIQERIIIDHAAKQNVPRYAEGDFLDSLAENFRDVYRLQPQAATTTIRFSITQTRPTAQIIPAGTRVSVDGNIIFETLENASIEAGELYVDATARCQTVGEIGNGFVAGQISQLVDIYPYYDTAENTTTSEGGAEREGDDAFYERIRESVESFSTAGPVGAYKYHALSFSALITDVSAESPTAGVVDVRVLLQGGELPGQQFIDELNAYLSADEVRPLTDTVSVAAPNVTPFDIDLTYYIPSPSRSNAAAIIAAVDDAVAKYIEWQTAKIGRDVNPSQLMAMLMETGIKRAVIREPTFATVAAGCVAQLNTQATVNGGFEDD